MKNQIATGLLVLTSLFGGGTVEAQRNTENIVLNDEQYAQISPMMREIEIENIEPAGWFFKSEEGPTDAVLNIDGENVALGLITLWSQLGDTASVYCADTIGFPLSNKLYRLENGNLYHKELGRLKAIVITPMNKKSWLVFNSRSVSKNSDPDLEILLNTKDVQWQQNGSSNLPGIPAVLIDIVDDNTEGVYWMSVRGPWPLRHKYGSFPLRLAERTTGTKSTVYEPLPEVGMQFPLTKKGYVFGNIPVKHGFTISREVKGSIGKAKRQKHNKETRF